MSVINWTDTVTPLNAANMSQLEQIVRKGAANGYASLDAGGKVPLAQDVLSPVTNGQWVKGVGGVPVWSALNIADVGSAWGSGTHAARPAASAPTAGMIYVATDRGGVWLSNGAGGWVLISQTPYYVSSAQFPASPYDGEELLWVDGSANPGWEFHCRYQAASTSAYKWEVIGCSGPYVLTTGSLTLTGDSTWRPLLSAAFQRAMEFTIRPHYFFVAAGTTGTAYQGYVGWGANNVLGTGLGISTVWGQYWNLVAGSDAIGTVAANQSVQSFYYLTIGTTGANCTASVSIWPRRVA